MAKQSNSKQKLLILRDIFMEKSDEDHALTIADLTNELSAYGISVERKTLYDDIELLTEYGVDIAIKKKGHSNAYYVATRTFEPEELFVLADAVACSKFLSERKSKALISKIQKLTSRSLSKQLTRSFYIQNRVKNFNERIYYSINAIAQGINSKKKITFRYFEYNIRKEKNFRNGGNIYTVSPYNLVWDNENYYLTCFCEKHNNISNYRVDRMIDVKVTDEAIRLITASQSAEVKDLRSTFAMFGGREPVRITMEFDNSLVGVVMDKFGSSVNMTKKSDTTFSVCEDVIISPPFWGWLFQLGDKAKILSPESAIKMAGEEIEKLRAVYNIQ